MIRAGAVALILSSHVAGADTANWSTQLDPDDFEGSLCRVWASVGDFDDILDVFGRYSDRDLVETLQSVRCDPELFNMHKLSVPIFHSLATERRSFAAIIEAAGNHLRATGQTEQFQAIINQIGPQGMTMLDYMTYTYGAPGTRDPERRIFQEVERAEQILCGFGGRYSAYTQPITCAADGE